MKTIRMYRASGKPITKQDQEGYILELNEEMDKLEKEHGKVTMDNSSIFTEKLMELDNKLLDVYPRQVDIDFPQTDKDFIDLCKKYGSVAFCLEEEELVLYILDD